MTNTLHLGDCAEVLKEYPDNYFDAIVCDPPAGISFMGKKWDDDKGGRDKWIAWMQTIAAEALRVMKPGAHALVWALPRTSHWTATAWENGGWEVRDRVAHIFGSGFPKSLDVSKAIDKHLKAEREVVGVKPGERYKYAFTSDFNPEHESSRLGSGNAAVLTAPATDAAKQFAGFGTALKPAMEDWWLLRKPIAESSIAANVLAWGTGGLNIDACRVESGERPLVIGDRKPDGSKAYRSGLGGSKCEGTTTNGRWPAQLIHDGSDCVMAEFPQSSITGKRSARSKGAIVNGTKWLSDNHESTEYTDSGSAARFFYCAKPSKAERNADGENNHPTLKSLALMRYLITLITPPGGIVLDLFAGSGTTIRAALELGFDAVGIEQDPEHFATMQRRAASATLPLFAEVAT